MDLSRCIELCTACHRTCVQAAIHCLARGGALAERDRVRLLWDCDQICSVSADFLSRGSRFHRPTCQACAIICEECAAECLRIDDPILAQCGEMCRDCAKSCREMAQP